MTTKVESLHGSTPVPGANTNSSEFHSHEKDLESQKSTANQEEATQSTSSQLEESLDPGLDDNSNVPRLPLLRLFWFFFYNFGLFAWGGPVAQISLIKDKLVMQDKWISLPRFQRVFAVYQILPGPEAAELYHSVIDHNTRKTSPYLVIAGLCTALNSALRINVFITRGKRIIALCLFILQYVVYAIYVVFRGVPSPVSLALGIAKTPFLPNLFALGLVAGSLSFGGAYTAIPFVQVEAVLKGGWLPAHIFLDGIAIGNILPAPLVIFATFVGYQGGLADGGVGTAFAGAILTTLGMFFPCFLFTIAGHDLLEKLVRNSFLSDFFDGLCGAVIGVIAIIVLQMLQSSLKMTNGSATADVQSASVVASESASAAVLYVIALAALYKSTNKYTPLVLVIIGAIAGQFLFV
ncbi:Chromate transport protein [Penicillium subrubescens]|uniref:Chromate transport protein n=1 Tax=Penicillium subrubescens TaxID=1316194 RepID=A0A1Q5UCP0_9EURO|nr:Chromate transport protein [Penicillium subrubescens]